MKKNKGNSKVIKIVIVIVVVQLFLITACSNTDRNVGVDKGDRTVANEVIIKWMIYGEKSKNSDDVFHKFNAALQSYYPGTTVEFEVIPKENYKERWDMKMATNETVDLAWIGNDLFNYTEEVKKGSFLALDYLLTTYGQDLLNDVPADIWELQKREGKIYSVPLLGMLYRKDYELVTSKAIVNLCGNLNEIGKINRSSQYTDTKCYEVIEQYLEKIKEENISNTGISTYTFSEIAKKGYEGIYGPDSPFVIKIFDDNLQVYNKYELETYKTYFKTMYEWYKKGYIREDIEEVLDAKSYDGKQYGSSLYLDEFGDYGVVLDKIDTEYETVGESLQSYKYISYESSRNAMVIPRTANNHERAMEIINLLNSSQGADLYRLLVNGFAGRHYVKNSSGIVDQIMDKNGNVLYRLSPYTLGNVYNDFEHSQGEFHQLKKYNQEAIKSPLLGFELDTRMIVLEMKTIDLVVDQFIEVLSNGTSDDWEDTYEQFISKIRLAGSQKVIDEMQRQIETFTESQN